MDTAEQRHVRWALRAALGNIRSARWFATPGYAYNPEQAGQHALDAMMFLGVAVQAGASAVSRRFVWRRCNAMARDVVRRLAPNAPVIEVRG